MKCHNKVFFTSRLFKTTRLVTVFLFAWLLVIYVSYLDKIRLSQKSNMDLVASILCGSDIRLLIVKCY